MTSYTHIPQFERILDHQQQLHTQLRQLLDQIQAHQEEYHQLVDYYYSDRYRRDIEDDDKNLIDPHLKRGILSEDAIYNLMTDHHQSAIQMLELATRFLKQK